MTNTESTQVWQGKGYGFRRNGKLYMIRCFDCGRENWAPAVATGRCAWCGHAPEPEKGKEKP